MFIIRAGFIDIQQWARLKLFDVIDVLLMKMSLKQMQINNVN